MSKYRFKVTCSKTCWNVPKFLIREISIYIYIYIFIIHYIFILDATLRILKFAKSCHVFSLSYSPDVKLKKEKKNNQLRLGVISNRLKYRISRNWSRPLSGKGEIQDKWDRLRVIFQVTNIIFLLKRVTIGIENFHKLCARKILWGAFLQAYWTPRIIYHRSIFQLIDSHE